MSDSLLTQAQAEARRQGEATASVTRDGGVTTTEASVKATWRGKAWEVWLKATGQYQAKPGKDDAVIKGEFGAKW